MRFDYDEIECSAYGENGDILAYVDEAAYEEQRKGLSVLSNLKANPATVPVFKESEDAKFSYIGSRDLQEYMSYAGIIDVEEAVSNIAKCNGLSLESTIVTSDGCDMFLDEALEESTVLYEKAAEDDAMSLNKAMKWYDKVVKASKNTKGDSEAVIKSKIKVLKQAVISMKNAKVDPGTGRVKYALKAIIPFNGIYRLFKHSDNYSGIGYLAGVSINMVFDIMNKNHIGGAVQMGIRFATYNKMLDSRIKSTEEAIKFLEGKLKK